MTTPTESQVAPWRRPVPPSPPKQLPLKRCLNCPKFYRQTKAWQKFCGIKCRREWQANGTAYAQLKHKLTKQIETSCFEHSKAAAERAIQDLLMTPAALAEEPRSRFYEYVEAAIIQTIGGAEGLAVLRRAVERKKKRERDLALNPLAPGYDPKRARKLRAEVGISR